MAGRTLKLSEKEFNLLTNALGIAEQVFGKKYSELTDLIVVRGNQEKKEQLEIANKFLNISSDFGNLNYELTQGEKDV
jgi:hypothetical protein